LVHRLLFDGWLVGNRWHAFRFEVFPLAQRIKKIAAQQASRALQPNQPQERELKGGETHDYSVQLSTREFMHAVVVQPIS